MAIAKLLQIMSRLRDPKTGCPWDIEQDFNSITPHTIEEAYEVKDAIENGDFESLKEELGDLLLQVVFYCQMAQEKNIFDFKQVVGAINDKLISRHPHVFGDEKIKSSKEQEIAWEEHKQKENQQKGKEKSSILDSITKALPAALRAHKLQKKAAKVGFDWDSLDGVFDKIKEETHELEVAHKNNDYNHIKEEVGDLLFAVVNLSRKLDVNPEEALHQTNRKFIRRFKYVEQKTKESGKTLSESNLEEMDNLWEEAKKQ